MSSRPEAAGARAQVYFALADTFVEPHADLQRVLGEAIAAGAALADSAACGTANRHLSALPAMPHDALRADYRKVMFGVGKRPLALYESLHRHGQLAGEATTEVAACYRALGLVPADGELPDHAGVELAFMGELATAEAAALTQGDWELAARVRTAHRTFLRSHAATWLPAIGDALSASGAPLYAPTGALLRDYLAEELAPRRSRVRPAILQPVLLDPITCTLCGLCAATCHPGALWMAEDGCATHLALDAARCIGCRQCVRVCPEQVLDMAQVEDSMASSHDVTAHRILAASTRAACPQCGQPTVSYAELQAVFRRLQPDPVLQRRFSLCVACKSMS